MIKLVLSVELCLWFMNFGYCQALVDEYVVVVVVRAAPDIPEMSVLVWDIASSRRGWHL